MDVRNGPQNILSEEDHCLWAFGNTRPPETSSDNLEKGLDMGHVPQVDSVGRPEHHHWGKTAAHVEITCLQRLDKLP